MIFLSPSSPGTKSRSIIDEEGLISYDRLFPSLEWYRAQKCTNYCHRCLRRRCRGGMERSHNPDKVNGAIDAQQRTYRQRSRHAFSPLPCFAFTITSVYSTCIRSFGDSRVARSSRDSSRPSYPGLERRMHFRNIQF